MATLSLALATLKLVLAILNSVPAIQSKNNSKLVLAMQQKVLAILDLVLETSNLVLAMLNLAPATGNTSEDSLSRPRATSKVLSLRWHACCPGS